MSTPGVRLRGKCFTIANQTGRVTDITHWTYIENTRARAHKGSGPVSFYNRSTSVLSARIHVYVDAAELPKWNADGWTASSARIAQLSTIVSCG